MYYVAVMDCEDEIHLLLGDSRHGRIEVKTHMRDDDSEIPYENRGYMGLDLALICAFMILIASNYHSYTKFMQRHDIQNSPHLYCICATVFQILAILFDFGYHLNYSITGEDDMKLYVASQILFMLSECMMILLLFMMANGWMTVWTKYDTNDGMELYLPFFLFVVIIHIVFVILTMVDRDAYHKYHDFSGVLGYCLIAVKFVMVGVYFYFYTETEFKVSKAAKPFYD